MNKLKLIVLFIFIVPIYANAYHHLSLYSYCAGNPVNNVDPLINNGISHGLKTPIPNPSFLPSFR